MTGNKIGVIGIGNSLKADDGAGLAVIESLQGQLPPGVKLIELGTGGINLVHELARLDHAIIIDAGDFNGKPGEIRKFKPDEVKSLRSRSYSLHDWDMFNSIIISQKMGECPRKISIIAIQPEDISFREGFSKTVQEKIPVIARMVIETVEEELTITSS